MNKILIEGLDRLGKDTLVNLLQQRLGFHHVLHFSKPLVLDVYNGRGQTSEISKREAQRAYQEASFRNMFMLLRDPYTRLIMNRAHLGECVYAPLYRGYDGEYVFSLEKQFDMANNRNARLILLLEDFKVAKHFADDGKSLGSIENRQREQELFIDAFNKSIIPDKRMICVTDPELGGFKQKIWILEQALAA